MESTDSKLHDDPVSALSDIIESKLIMQKSDMKPLHLFSDLHVIGKGGFSVVFSARYEKDSKIYALKMIPMTEEVEKDTRREITILADLNHRNVLKYFKDFIMFLPMPVYYKPVEYTCNNVQSYNESVTPAFDEVSIIMTELCERTLDDYLSQTSVRNKRDIIRMVIECILGIKYIHERGVVHQDLKLDNIFLHEGELKFGDFGSAELFENEQHDLMRDIESIFLIVFDLVYPMKTDRERTDIRRKLLDCNMLPKDFSAKAVFENDSDLMKKLEKMMRADTLKESKCAMDEILAWASRKEEDLASSAILDIVNIRKTEDDENEMSKKDNLREDNSSEERKVMETL